MICGDLRLWPQAAEYIFNFAETRAHQVDYYFATWSTTRDHWWPEDKSINSIRPVQDSDILDKFVGRNLIDCTIADQTRLPRHDITIYYQSYLAKLANLAKRKYELENDFKYDQVIEVRPDLYLTERVDSIPVCKDFEVIAGTPYDNNSVPFTQLNDFYYRSSSIGNDIISNRYYYRKSIEVLKFQNSFNHWGHKLNNHWVLYDYLFARRISLHPDVKEIKDQVPIRPNFPKDNLHEYSIYTLRKLDNEWIEYQWK